ncbi:MAG TPA: M48 family metallopeptidase [Candidatus Limnocylindrales bacterium]|nr:M48 family metallopeptidase [Candidatus Limnocylindrales bacterium]
MVRLMAHAICIALLCSLLAIITSAQTAAAEPASAQPVAAATASSPPFDVNSAVEFYLAKMPPAERAHSNSYFEGGYWLQLWDFLSTVLVMSFLLKFGWSRRMRDLAERITRLRPLQTALYWLQFILTLSVVTFPLGVYEGYFREHKYGLLNQSFGPWMRDQVIALVVSVVFGGILIMLLFGIVRRLGKNWWVWGSVASILFLMFVSTIAPVYIFPLFNKFTKLQDARIKDPILSMARANGIPATDVYEFDASRQSNRVSANVSGFGSTQRISLNDNLLNRCTLPEIETTMGHEMGHYVLNHATKGVFMYGVVVVLGFAFLNWFINLALARWGESWGIRGITDVAVLPLATIGLSIYFLLMTPVSNTITRTMEFEADMYGLNAARQPDGEANVDLLLGEYRKMEPSPLEEFFFFDHPSGRTRITAAMRWKAEHPETASAEELARPVFTSH